MPEYLTTIGIMTGNSLDGADLVLTRFFADGTITDLASHSVSSPADLADSLRFIRKVINDSKGRMEEVVSSLKLSHSPYGDFDEIEDKYTRFIARGVKELVDIAEKQGIRKEDIDAIGSHGQTCAHYPPSIASKDGLAKEVYTIQIGDPQKLADLTGITVIADFRSDDLMNGGEGAPLAPIHHKHLAECVKSKGYFPIAFCNAGNTGNLSIISRNEEGDICSIGFDTGPFNNFPDKLMQKEKGQNCDKDGAVAAKGNVNLDLLRLLFDHSVLTGSGENFLLKPPPRSSDPEWYKMIPELTGDKTINGATIPFEDRIRTAEYFSAYIFFYALAHISSEIELPRHFAICGGGWRNPLITGHFTDLLNGNFSKSPVLSEHLPTFEKIRTRLAGRGAQVSCNESIFYGFDGTAMEARIFADAAFCRVKGEPFSLPETTGAKAPTVAGIIRYKNANASNATINLKAWLDKYNSRDLTVDNPAIFDNRWNRATAGWSAKLSSL